MNRTVRPGGSALLLGAILLIVATVAEIGSLSHPADHGARFWFFAVTLLLASAGFLTAGILLAASDVAGPAARVVLVVFGLCWPVAQVLYLWGSYLKPATGLVNTSTVISIVMLIAGLVAGADIARRRSLPGGRRWALLGAVVLSAVAGAVANGATADLTVTAFHLVSAAGFVAAGATWVTMRTTASAATPAVVPAPAH